MRLCDEGAAISQRLLLTARPLLAALGRLYSCGRGEDRQKSAQECTHCAPLFDSPTRGRGQGQGQGGRGGGVAARGWVRSFGPLTPLLGGVDVDEAGHPDGILRGWVGWLHGGGGGSSISTCNLHPIPGRIGMTAERVCCTGASCAAEGGLAGKGGSGKIGWLVVCRQQVWVLFQPGRKLPPETTACDGIVANPCPASRCIVHCMPYSDRPIVLPELARWR